MSISLGALLYSMTHDIIMNNDIATDVHCNGAMSHEIAICTYHDITVYNGIAILFR